MHDRGITGAPVYVDDVTGVSGALCSASPFVDVPPSFPPNPFFRARPPLMFAHVHAG